MNPSERRTTSVLATTVVLATAGGLVTALAAPASAAVTCTSPVYKRQFFANTTFSGTAKRTDCDPTISDNWGARAPISSLSANNFSVRWTATRDFGSGGPFTFSVSGQDGIRVYLDGSRKIDLWKNVSSTVSKAVNVTIPAGTHTLRVDYVNWTGSATVKFAYAPRTAATVDKTKPLVPAGFFVAYDQATGKAKAVWSKNKEMDLAGYRIYRRPKGGTGYTRLVTTTATSYTDATLPVTGAGYYYEIRAYDKAGNESTGTADKLVTTVDRTAPAVPTAVTASADTTTEGVRITWGASSGATSYRVYRAASADGTYTRVGSTSQLTYLDTAVVEGTTYYYRVSAVDAVGNESVRSAADSGVFEDWTPPSAVTGVTVTPTEYGFEVRWDPNPTADLARYVVRRGELVGEEGEQMCSLFAGYYLLADTTSYAYAAVPDGEESCFVVDAVDDDWNSSVDLTGEAQVVVATELDMAPAVAMPEGSPVELTAHSEETGVGLSWNEVTDATGYQVYRWNPGTQAYEKLAATTGTSYEDSGAAKGTTHFYWVTALYADGTESAPGARGVALVP